MTTTETEAPSEIGVRFLRDTADHEMTVLHSDGLYRHLRFRAQKHSMYWFDLITVPGALIFQGDGESFVFSRLTDMFEFFRSSAWKGKPNVHYWAEKLTSEPSKVRRYDQDLLADQVRQHLADTFDEEPVLDGLEAAVQDEVLGALIGDEGIDRDTVSRFQFFAEDNEDDGMPDFTFGEIWEWNCRDYDWWFLWVCHAIIWGIARFDGVDRPPVPDALPIPAEPPRPKPVPYTPRYVTVNLPETEAVP